MPPKAKSDTPDAPAQPAAAYDPGRDVRDRMGMAIDGVDFNDPNTVAALWHSLDQNAKTVFKLLAGAGIVSTAPPDA